MYILILVILAGAFTSNTPLAATSTSVPGFTSLEACMVAGADTRSAMSNRGQVVFSCVRS